MLGDICVLLIGQHSSLKRARTSVFHPQLLPAPNSTTNERTTIPRFSQRQAERLRRAQLRPKRRNAYCRWRVMSETYRQQAFGRPTFIDGSASGSSSGRDRYDILDATNLYHDHDHDYAGHRVQPLHIPPQEGFPPGHQYAYASHSSGVSLPGKRTSHLTAVRPSSHVGYPYPSSFLAPLILAAPCSWVAIPTPLGCRIGMTFIWLQSTQ